MSVRYTLAYSDTTSFPTNSAQTFNHGFNLPGGAVDELIMRLTVDMNAAADLDGDTSNIIDSMRIILNGETCWDFQAQVAAADDAGPGVFGYLMNSLGKGRSMDVPSGDLAATDLREYYARIPVGRNLAAGISRMEFSLGYAALSAAASAGTLEWWVRYNPAMQTTVTLGAATTFTYTATTQQIVCRVPQNVPGTLAGVLIQTDSNDADEITDIRIVSQSDFAMDIDMWRLLNGDLDNGIAAFIPGTSGTQQTYVCEAVGQIFIPLYSLSLKDDLRMQVTANAGGTLSASPVITSPIAASPHPPRPKPSLCRQT